MPWPALVIGLLLVAACGGDASAGEAAEESSGSERPATVAAAGATEAAAEARSRRKATPKLRPPLPEPVEGTFALPVRVPFSTIADLIDGELPRHEKQGYQRLTRPGRSPEIEARYEFWRDPVRVRFSGSTLQVEVPVRYAARFNGRVKNPFGGQWLRVARDEPWGSERDPLRVTLRLRTKVDISSRWKLSLKTTVDRPEHGPPPKGKICTGGSFRLCVSKASIAPQVQKQMDAELLSRIDKAVATFDRVAVRKVALPSRVERVLAALLQPRPTDHGRWMTLQPRAAALSLRAEVDAIVAEPALQARLRYHEDKPTPRSPSVPKRKPLSKLSSTRLALPDAFVPPEVRALLSSR